MSSALPGTTDLVRSYVVETRPGSADDVADDDRQRIAGLELDRLVMPEVPGANLRAAEILTSTRRSVRHDRPRHGCARIAAPWVSCVPCEKFRRKTSVPAPMSAANRVVGIAGRTDRRDDFGVPHTLRLIHNLTTDTVMV